jgi:hypothetical protein
VKLALRMDLPRASDRIGHFLHAAAQAPWRAQRQWIGGLLLVALAMAMVASLYLDITSQAAIAGRQIQETTSQVAVVELANSDLASKLAEISSADSMERRAATLGYQPIDSGKLQYVLVPGYHPPAPDILASTQTLQPSAASMLPEYTESLISWLGRYVDGLGFGGTP